MQAWPEVHIEKSKEVIPIPQNLKHLWLDVEKGVRAAVMLLY